jgi:2-polyprenyl-6-methoxyphenol hydroxylase-like FAD-dependent oxidoreductase
MDAEHSNDRREGQRIRSIASALVVGGGIGGMAACIALKERGVAVELIDIDPEWRVYGAGITITGPTLRAYKQLGMVEDIAEQGAVTPGSAVFTYAGHFLRDLDEPPLEKGLPATGGIMRPVLHRIMQERVTALEIPVRLGITVDKLENIAGGVSVTFSDGSDARYDLVIGADSVNSRVRTLSFPHMGEPVRTGQGCWRVSTRRPPSLEKGEMYFGHRYTAGITRCGEEQVYLWLLTPHIRREVRFTDSELFDTMRGHLADFGGNAGWIRDNMTPDDWVNYRPLAAMIQPRPWSDGRVVLLGDAVHATTPHLASGAGMAVESAIVLAQELAAADSAEDALRAYEERRFERCRDVVESSIAIGAAQLAGAPPDQVGGMIGGALHRLAAPY